MHLKKFLILLALTSSALLFAGCQTSEKPSDQTSANTETDAPGFENESESSSQIESTIVLDKTYWAGSNVRVRMLFDKDGNCKYGYIGKYALTDLEDGTHLLTFIYYADTDLEQIASSTFALRDNGDGTYTKSLYTEEDGAYFDDPTVTTILTPDEGTNGLMSAEPFDGVYLSSDGQYYTFQKDGSFAMETWMTYKANDTHIELSGVSSSTLYTYTTEDDFRTLTLYKEEKKVMDLISEEAMQEAQAEAETETETEAETETGSESSTAEDLSQA